MRSVYVCGYILVICTKFYLLTHRLLERKKVAFMCSRKSELSKNEKKCKQCLALTRNKAAEAPKFEKNVKAESKNNEPNDKLP